MVSAVSWRNWRGREPCIRRLARFLPKIIGFADDTQSTGWQLPTGRCSAVSFQTWGLLHAFKPMATPLHACTHALLTHKEVTRPAVQVTCFQGLGKHGLPALRAATMNVLPQ